MNNFFEALASYVKDGVDTDILQHLESPNDAKKLAVFRNTYLSSCVDTLKRKYPTCVNVLGEEYFHQLALSYVLSNPPSSNIMSKYGDGISDFMLTTLPDTQFDYVVDLALMDKAWHKIYFADTDHGPSDDDLTRWVEDIDVVQLALKNTVILLKNSWTVTTVWAAIKQNALTEKAHISNEQEYVLMWRDEEGIILHRLLTQEEWIFLDSIQSGRTLTDAADNAARTGDIDISHVFSRLITNQLLKEI